METVKIDNLNPRIYLQINSYLGLKDMLQLSQVSKKLRKLVAKSFLPKLKSHYDLQSYLEKYPYKCLRTSLNKKLLVMNFSELDNLLTNGSRVKPKNVPENPDSEISMMLAAQKPVVQE
jgi:hypothetical protein